MTDTDILNAVRDLSRAIANERAAKIDYEKANVAQQAAHVRMTEAISYTQRVRQRIEELAKSGSVLALDPPVPLPTVTPPTLPVVSSGKKGKA